MLAPNEGPWIACDRRFQALVGRENEGPNGIAIEGVGGEADRHVQEGELLGLPDAARLQVGLKPADDVHDRACALRIEANDEGVFIPAPSYVFAPEPPVDHSAQVGP